MFTTLTDDQKAIIEQVGQQMLAKVTQPLDYEKSNSAVVRLYAESGRPAPHILWTLSPQEAIHLGGRLLEIWNKPQEALRTAMKEVLPILKNHEEFTLIDQLLRMRHMQPVSSEALIDFYGEILARRNPEGGSGCSEEVYQVLQNIQPTPKNLRAAALAALTLYYHQGYLGVFEACKQLGVSLDEKSFNLLEEVALNLSYLLVFDQIAILSQNPVEIYWDEKGRLHKDDGPAILYKDGFSHWSIDGIEVNEQIVMNPSSQSIDEMAGERNTEVRALRIKRYGWENFLSLLNSEILDTKIISTFDASGVEVNWMETLTRGRVEDQTYVILSCYDPSTGRPYALPVDESVETCAEAQRYLLGIDHIADTFGLDAGKVTSYPVVRS